MDPGTGITDSGVLNVTCGRQLNYAQGFSPIGMRLNLRPKHRLQVTLSTLGGYLLSAKQLPVANAGSFNFDFEFGGGLEYFRTAHSAVRLEFAYQHYSNGNTAPENPGVDSGVFKATYTFGR